MPLQANLGLVGDVSARIGYGPLPEQTPAALDQLDKRTREILGWLYDDRDAADKVQREIRKELASLSERLNAAIAAMGEQTRRVAVGGIHLQVVGFVLIAFGLVLQGIGAAVGA